MKFSFHRLFFFTRKGGFRCRPVDFYLGLLVLHLFLTFAGTFCSGQFVLDLSDAACRGLRFPWTLQPAMRRRIQSRAAGAAAVCRTWWTMLWQPAGWNVWTAVVGRRKRLTFFFSQSPELRSPDITEWEGSRAFGDLDLRVLANARRAEEKTNSEWN